MATLLQIDSSPRGDRSVSRQLTTAFSKAWLANHPGGRVIYRDLRDTPIPHIDDPWINSAKTSAAERSEEDRRRLALSEELIAELTVADHFVFGVPMYNYTVPSSTKAYIDHVIRSGQTVSYANGGLVSLLQNKVATAITTSSARFQEGTPQESGNFLAPYLRKILGLLASTDIDVIVVDGLADPSYRETSLARAHEKVRERALLPAVTADVAELVHA